MLALTDSVENMYRGESTLTPPPRRSSGALSSAAADRFIPNRSAFSLSVSQFEVERRRDGENVRLDYNASPAKEEYKRELASTLYHGRAESNRLLAFGSPPPKKRLVSSPARSTDSEVDSPSLQQLYALNKANRPPAATRRVPQMAERILDAPELVDDYYLNLLDWCGPAARCAAPGEMWEPTRRRGYWRAQECE